MKIKKLTPEVVKDKIVLIRMDYNVPLKEGKVVENTRIVESLPMIQFLLDNGAKQIHVLTHLGRPKGQVVPELSAKFLIPELEKQLGQPVEFRPEYTAGDSRIQLHENVRFRPEEKTNEPNFPQEILDGIKPDVFILEGFAVAHRPQASVIGFAGQIPCYPGFGIEKEIEHLSPFLSEEKMEGLTVIVGGVKMETKVAVLQHFAKIADNIVIGGALGNTFMVAQGYEVGGSLYEEAELDRAREVMEIADANGTAIHSPVDVVCADDLDAVESTTVPVEDVMGDMKILDIGPHTIASYKEIIAHSKVLIWNGPVGLFEKDLFENGTKELAGAIAQNKEAKTILGGGDTLGALKKFDIAKSEFTHVSTGGGAMLEFLEGKKLPGIEILKD
jgi:phosphoglycerate kinase